MKKLGRHITAKEIKDIIGKYDRTNEGFITYEEFKDVFRNTTAVLERASNLKVQATT